MAEVMSIDDAVERRIQRVLDELSDRPEYASAVNRSRLTLTDFLRSWSEGAVPSRERMTTWALDWIERRTDRTIEGEQNR